MARITHIDAEHPDLNKIIKPEEASYAAGKPGRFFVGLKKDMIKRLRSRWFDNLF